MKNENQNLKEKLIELEKNLNQNLNQKTQLINE